MPLIGVTSDNAWCSVNNCWRNGCLDSRSRNGDANRIWLNLRIRLLSRTHSDIQISVRSFSEPESTLSWKSRVNFRMNRQKLIRRISKSVNKNPECCKKAETVELFSILIFSLRKFVKIVKEKSDGSDKCEVDRNISYCRLLWVRGFERNVSSQLILLKYIDVRDFIDFQIPSSILAHFNSLQLQGSALHVAHTTSDNDFHAEESRVYRRRTCLAAPQASIWATEEVNWLRLRQTSRRRVGLDAVIQRLLDNLYKIKDNIQQKAWQIVDELCRLLQLQFLTRISLK